MLAGPHIFNCPSYSGSILAIGRATNLVFSSLWVYVFAVGIWFGLPLAIGGVTLPNRVLIPLLNLRSYSKHEIMCLWFQWGWLWILISHLQSHFTKLSPPYTTPS